MIHWPEYTLQFSMWPTSWPSTCICCMLTLQHTGEIRLPSDSWKPVQLPQSKGKCCTLSVSPLSRKSSPVVGSRCVSYQFNVVTSWLALKCTSATLSFGSFIQHPQECEAPNSLNTDGLTPLRAAWWLTFTNTACSSFCLTLPKLSQLWAILNLNS